MMFDKKTDSTKAEAVKIGKMVFHQDELEIPITYRGEVFVLQYPNAFQKAQIETDIARRLAGLSRESYPLEHLNMMEAVCYVNALVIPEKSPAWFKSAHTSYDDELIANLYAGYLSFRDEFRAKIRSDGNEGDGSGAGS